MKLAIEILQGEHKGMKVYSNREWYAANTLYQCEYTFKGQTWLVSFGQFKAVTE